MKKNRYANNEAGVIKAPNKPSNSPKATVTKGSDLRNGTKKSKWKEKHCGRKRARKRGRCRGFRRG